MYPNSNHRQAWIQRGPTTAATTHTFVITTARDANTSPSSNSNSQNVNDRKRDDRVSKENLQQLNPPLDPYLTPHSCPSCKAFAPSKMCPCEMGEVVVCGDVAVKGHVNVVKDGLFSCNSECGKTLGCGNHVCKETCHPGVCGDCELLPDMSSYISVRSAGSILNLEVSSGPSRGTHYSIQSTNKSKLRLTLGRVLPSDLLVVDSEVSGKHPVINLNLNKLPAPLQPDEANGKRTPLGQRKLVCDDECSKLERKKVLADAFGAEATVINQCTQLLTPSSNPTYVMTYINTSFPQHQKYLCAGAWVLMHGHPENINSTNLVGKYHEELGKWEAAITLMLERAALHEQKAQVLLEIGET
ncbi:protein phosphatase 2C 70 [Tanacetum coccineum]